MKYFSHSLTHSLTTLAFTLTLFLTCNPMLQAQDVYQDFAVSKGYQSFFLKNIVKTDSYRNVYQAGATLGDDGDYDVILSKSNPKGIEIWTKVFDLAGYNDAAVDIQIDGFGNIYVAGTTFNPSNSGYQILILKYNSGGTLLWQHTYSSPGSLYNVATSIAIDNDRVYIGGITYNVQNEADFCAVAYSLSGDLLWHYLWDNVGLNDGITGIYMKGSKLYLAGGTETGPNKWKYCIQSLNSTNGSIIDQNITGGSSDGIDKITDLTRDNAGNVYVTGGAVNQNTGYDYRTIKLDSTLNIIWSKTYNSSGSYDDIANGLAVDNSGNVYVTGQSQTSANGTDYTTIKYTYGGSETWVNTYNGTASGADSAKAIAIDASQNVIITGVSENGANTDIHTVKYSSAGNEIWQIDFNGIENGDDRSFDLSIDALGDIIVGGQTFANGNFRYVAIKYKEVEVTGPFGNTTPTNNSGDFIANYGQLYDSNQDPVSEIRYSGADRNAFLFLEDDALNYTLATSDGNTSTEDTLCGFKLELSGANKVRVYGKEKNDGYYNYYFPHIPKGRERVPAYKTLVYPDIWREIDLTLTNGNLGTNYYFVLKPGGNLNSLNMLLSNQNSVSVDQVSGELRIETACGTHRLPAPDAYQIGSSGQLINLSWTPQYVLNGSHISFSTGNYNTNLPLVISLDRGAGGIYDEPGLCWSTYFSGYGTVESQTIQYNKDELILASANVGPGAFIFSEYSSTEFVPEDYKACVFQLKNNYAVDWMTFYGGANSTYVTDMAQKSNGEIYCIGSSRSLDLELITEDGATAYEHSGQGTVPGSFAYDALLYKINLQGEIVWSTFLGDSYPDHGDDYGKNIVATSDNKIYITGTASGANFQHFPSDNSFQGGLNDVFICEFNANDVHTWTHFLGGSGRDRPYGLGEDELGNMWIQGTTNSSNFPVHNPNPSDPDVFYDTQLSGFSDDFVSQIAPGSYSVIYSTYFGGNKSESDFYPRLIVHSDYLTTGQSKLYMIGRTKSSGSTFPILADGGSFNYNINNLGTDTYSSPSNGYIIALNPTNYHQTWGTFMNNAINAGGSDSKNWPHSAHLLAYANDTGDKLAICGGANSPNELDVTGFLSYTSGPSGGSDGFVYIFNAGLSTNNLTSSTFFGGAQFEHVIDIAYRNIYQLAICGVFSSDGTNVGFPLDNPGNGALFTDYIYPNSTDGFFTEFCHEEPTGTEDVNQARSDHSLSVYPNPSTLDITVSGFYGKDLEYSVYDISGRILLHGTVRTDEAFQIDIHTLSPGAYVLQMKSQKNIQTAKFIKQ